MRAPPRAPLDSLHAWLRRAIARVWLRRWCFLEFGKYHCWNYKAQVPRTLLFIIVVGVCEAVEVIESQFLRTYKI